MAFEDVGIFFDRDGTINTELDFLREPDELVLIPGAARAIREANALGVKVFVITNQSGVARGFLTEDDLRKVHERLTELLAREGAFIDEIYYCPHHPTLGSPPYDIVCDCRKPKPGMLLRARDKFDLDLSKSYVVGDRLVDMQTGNNAHSRSVLVLTGYGEREKDECLLKAEVDHVADNIGDAWEFIRRRLERGEETESHASARRR
ncbi:MAG TPA: D-glycero-beta-D-manno-heptose 1,7-bisphosphate 7-phosphatase [Bacteroidota bacterium]|nr:D-glycero-beta-D-manno-heptose 1,7-bisphosphate 7-phosphatase [Bacteroidota bacterium]